ncbi:hypothetical protein K1719_011956 [Acacia pycnantha]|nr:hypothetical protein K1719_011956 [Acacia pycnantha]
MAVTGLVYIQDEVGRSWAYGICSVSMLIIFLYGTKRYRYKKSMGSPIVHIFEVIVAAIRKKKMDLPYNIGSLYEEAAIVAEDDLEKNIYVWFCTKPLEIMLINKGGRS